MRAAKTFRSFLFWKPLPLLISTASILLAINVSIQQSITTAQVAAESKARSELAEQIAQQQSNAFCDLFVSISNPTIQPASLSGAQFVLKFRNTVSVLQCPHEQYYISSETLTAQK